MFDPEYFYYEHNFQNIFYPIIITVYCYPNLFSLSTFDLLILSIPFYFITTGFYYTNIIDIKLLFFLPGTYMYAMHLWRELGVQCPECLSALPGYP